eukprot:s14_g13.t1
MPSDVEEAVIRRRLPARYKQEHFERVSINGFWILSALKDEYRGVFTALKLDDVFSEDQLLLQATLTASFAPFYAHGITRCMDYTSALKGPQTSRRVSKSLDDGSKESAEDQAEAQVVMLKADPQIAKVHGQALAKADMLDQCIHGSIVTARGLQARKSVPLTPWLMSGWSKW